MCRPLAMQCVVEHSLKLMIIIIILHVIVLCLRRKEGFVHSGKCTVSVPFSLAHTILELQKKA